MKILGRISLLLTVFALAFVVFTRGASAQTPPTCGDYQPTTGCICNGQEYQGYCFPANINSCAMISGACHCATTDGTDTVVDAAMCGGGNTGGGGGTGTAGSVFGSVKAPPGVDKFNAQVTGPGEKIGIIIFASNLIRIATIVAGIIVFLNFILAGYAYITSDGSAKVNEQVKNQLTYSVIGLVIIVASYTIIAIISLLLFGKADFILNPTITGPK